MALGGRVKARWSLSTIAIARRGTNGWKGPGFMLPYLFALAYIFAGITCWAAVAPGL